MFCPEVHGMMSGGMIGRATKAAYDYHHPGARPCPSSALSTAADREGGGSGGGGNKRGGTDGADEVKVNVVDLQQEQRPSSSSESASSRLRLIDGGPIDADHSASLALVKSRANGNMGGGGGGDGSIFFGSRRDADGGLGVGVGGRQRRRGPAPIHHGGGIGGGRGGMDDSEQGGPEVVQRNIRDSSDGEYLTMLVPSGALDWGASSLAVRAALNATTTESGTPSGGDAWVEIDCQILNARLVQDVTFSG